MSEYIVNRACDDYDIGSFRHAAYIGANTIRFTVPQITLFAPIQFNPDIDVEIIGYSSAYGVATTITNYGLIFQNMNNVAVKSLTFSNVNGDGIQFYTTQTGKVFNCYFLNGVANSDESISAVKGCGNIEIAYCGFSDVKKCILLGTGDGDDYLTDKNTIVSIHENIFYSDCERRYPYGTGIIGFTNNWVMGWTYHDTQSFAFRLRQGGRGFINKCIFEQQADFLDGSPMNQLNSGGANQAVTVEDDAKIYISSDNSFSPDWLVQTSNGTSSMFTTEELAQIPFSQIDISLLKAHLIDNIGPKPL